MTNKKGQKFKEGHIYFCPGIISFGINGNGFHFCKRIEDTFRYFPTLESSLYPPLESIAVAEVVGSGNIVEGQDDYNGYYDLYVSQYLEVGHVLNREEIMELACDMVEMRLTRLVSTYRLTEEEITKIEGKYLNVDLAINFFQRGKKDTYQEYFNSQKILEKQVNKTW